MGTEDNDRSATPASDSSLVVLITGVCWPGSTLDWKPIEDYLDYLGVDHCRVNLGCLRKWWALFVRDSCPGLALRLSNEIGSKSKEKQKEHGPAVIAHSFGAVILGQMLKDQPRNQSLGRCVLFGSALHPDFPWHEYLQKYSKRWSLEDFRNVVGKLDWVLKCFAPLAAKAEGFWIRRHGGEPMLGQSGLSGFRCDRERTTSPCADHNRDYSDEEWRPLGRHNTAINALNMPTWFYFLGVWPRLEKLEPIDKVRLARRSDSVPWRPVDDLFEYLRDRKPYAILVEGHKGTGKSYAAISAARKLYDHKDHDNQPIYYLDGGTVDRDTRGAIRKSIERLPLGATLIIDDLHRSIAALEVAIEALDISKASLMFVSRPLPSENKYQLLRRACEDREDCYLYLMPTGQRARADLCGLIRATLDRRLSDLAAHPADIQRNLLDDVAVSAFYNCFPDNLVDLFDAISAWQPGKPINDTLADEAIKIKWRQDPDFRRGLRLSDPGFHPGWYEQALAALVVVGAWWQFERRISQAALFDHFDVSFDVTSDLTSRGVLWPRDLIPKGLKDESERMKVALEYSLDHELRARRYVRVAASDGMFTGHLAKTFAARGLALPSNSAGLTDYILLLGICGVQDSEEQAKFFRDKIYDPLMFGGYDEELLRITATIRNHLDKLKPPARVQILADGGAVRRRIDSLDEAWEWLAEAERISNEHGLSNTLGLIFYERAYVRYLNYDFGESSRMFEESAKRSPSFWRDVSEAKAAEARFQHAMRDDHFSRNLDPTRALDATLTETLGQVRQILGTKRSALNGFEEEGAKRWACRLLLHLADVCLETGDDRKAQELLKASESNVRAQYPAFEPVLEYLYGRVALINNQPADALEHLKTSLWGYKARVREPEGLGDLLIAIGDTHRLSEELHLAREYYTRALHVDDERKNGHVRAVAAAAARLT